MYFLLEKNKKGGFFTMIKNRRTSGLLSMALATCLVVSAVPVQTVDSILGNAAGRVTALCCLKTAIQATPPAEVTQATAVLPISWGMSITMGKLPLPIMSR